VQLTREPERVVITIEMMDLAFPPSEREKVFELSTRHELSRNRRDWRVGLGLFVTRSIIWEHGGDIRTRKSAGGRLARPSGLPGPESQTPTDTNARSAKCSHRSSAITAPELVRRRIPRCPVSRRGVDSFVIP